MNSKTILKFLIIIGGIVEIFLGILFLFVDVFLERLGLINISIFTQMAGSFLFGYGILLLYSSRNVEKYKIIPLINILIRGLVIVFGILTSSEIPEFLGILIFAIVYDSFWSISVLFLMQKSRLIFKQS
ncbi:MAG: hypothetical protein ACW986_01385 [Promethearchaeota archaeon]|jgi:hypothetical protein